MIKTDTNLCQIIKGHFKKIKIRKKQLEYVVFDHTKTFYQKFHS